MDEMQQKVDAWIRTYGVRYFDEQTNMLMLMEEVGELSRWMARTYGEQSFKNEEMAEHASLGIREEIADIYFVLCCLANQMEINLSAALEESIIKKTQRDALRHQQNEKLKN